MSDQPYSPEPPANDGSNPPGDNSFDSSQPYVPPAAADSQPTPATEPPYGAPQYQAEQPYSAGQYQTQPPYQTPAATPGILPDHPSATPSLILGILSLIVCGITAPFGLYMSIKGRREVSENPGVYRDGGTLTAGFVLNIIGIVNLAGWVIGLIFWLFVFGLAAAGSASGY